MNFSLIGAAGYVAPRHMKAIRETGNQLVSVFDIHDTLGIMDQYFPEAACFSDQEQYDDYHRSHPLHYVSVCSPNHLHFNHISWALEKGADVICEKPMVLDPSHLEILKGLEQETGKKISTILQLRQLPAMKALKEKLEKEGQFHQVVVDYVSARGNWYFNSWKGKEALSGGLITNIGIHLFDLLLWLFGAVRSYRLTQNDPRSASGTLELQRASVKWFLSIDPTHLPSEAILAQKRTFRQIRIDGEPLRLDDGLENLHTDCYRAILNGQGLGIAEAAPSIQLCHELRSS